jgi:hypothetical protein
MKESCYCGRTGDLEDRDPTLDGGTRVLRCPGCGHGDDLCWLSEEAGLLLWEEAVRLRGGPAEEMRPAA